MAGGDAIIPDVVISEMHSDQVTVTNHPVDTGADLSDHAIIQPTTVTCTFAWSDSSRAINSALDGSILQGLDTTKDVYEKLLALMRARQPLRLSTGKRAYENVIITALKTTSSVETESSAIIEITFQEVFMAQAQTVSLSRIKQKNAGRTGGKTNRGSQQLISMQGSRFGRG